MKPSYFFSLEAFWNHCIYVEKGHFFFLSLNDYETLLSFTSRKVKYSAMHGTISQDAEPLRPKCQEHACGETVGFPSAVVIPPVIHDLL